jgi:hypothetical protein
LAFCGDQRSKTVQVCDSISHQHLMLPHFSGSQNAPSLSDIMLTLQVIVEQNTQLSAITVDIQSRVEKLEARANGRSHQSQRKPLGEHQECLWRCPICFKALKHGESFKGHIRKLLPANIASRPKCRFKPDEAKHLALVQRFEGPDFYAQAANFIQAFYAFVRCAVTSAYSSHQSFAYITSWITAAHSVDVPFIELPRVSSSDQRHKRPKLSSDDESEESP